MTLVVFDATNNLMYFKPVFEINQPMFTPLFFNIADNNLMQLYLNSAYNNTSNNKRTNILTKLRADISTGRQTSLNKENAMFMLSLYKPHRQNGQQKHKYDKLHVQVLHLKPCVAFHIVGVSDPW